MMLVPSECRRRRPFYNLAHMSNSMTDVMLALATGANGIEFDVQFAEDGQPLYVYHGYICDCLRKCNRKENFPAFLRFIARLTTPSSSVYNDNFTFAFVDLKTDVMTTESARTSAGENLFKAIHENLFDNGRNRPRVKLLLSLLTLYDDQIIRGFMMAMEDIDQDYFLNQHIGWDVSNGQPITLIKFLFNKLLKIYKLNVWQSDGITNCLSMVTPHDRAKDAVIIRDSEQNYMSKVCHWTVDMKGHVRRTLRLGVDAILTNYPANAFKVLMEDEFKDKYRLAGHDDDPWQRFED